LISNSAVSMHQKQPPARVASSKPSGAALGMGVLRDMVCFSVKSVFYVNLCHDVVFVCGARLNPWVCLAIIAKMRWLYGGLFAQF